MNYAAIGEVIAHEITHGFDDKGSGFDSNGNWYNWWNTKTREFFLQKAKCFIEQYGNYTNLKSNLSLNGNYTQGRLMFAF